MSFRKFWYPRRSWINEWRWIANKKCVYYICKTKPNQKNPPHLEQSTLGKLSLHLLPGNRFFFLLGETFPLFWVHSELVCFAWQCALYGICPVPPVCLSLQEGKRIFTCIRRGVHVIHHPKSTMGRGLLAMEVLHTL